MNHQIHFQLPSTSAQFMKNFVLKFIFEAIFKGRILLKSYRLVRLIAIFSETELEWHIERTVKSRSHSIAKQYNFKF